MAAELFDVSDDALVPQPLSVDDRAFLDLKAEQIRAVAASAVIEIGRHLIEAKKCVGHGHFLAWLAQEFPQWNPRSANEYMAIAERLPNLRGRADLEITYEAMRLLAGPTVPEPARVAAIAEAEDGKRITKKRADELIDEARRAAFDEAVAHYRADLEKHVEDAVQLATAELEQDRTALQEKIKQIRDEAANLPGIEAALCQMLKQPKLTPDQRQNLAQLLNMSLSFNNVTYAPVSKERQKQVEEHLHIAGAVTRALETLAGVPPAQSFFDVVWPVQRNQHRRVIKQVLVWLSAYADVLEREEKDAAAKDPARSH